MLSNVAGVRSELMLPAPHVFALLNNAREKRDEHQ
jgi:hypothetical protein